MVKMVAMTAWIRHVQDGEKVKDQDVDETHGKNEGVYSEGGVLRVVIVIITVICIAPPTMHVKTDGV